MSIFSLGNEPGRPSGLERYNVIDLPRFFELSIVTVGNKPTI